MKLSQTNGHLLDYFGERGSLECLCKSGFSCVDISFFTRFKRGSVYFSDNYMSIIEEYKRALSDFNMTPVQSHEPAGNCIGDDGGEYYMKKTPRAIEMAAKIGCPSITVHPGKNNTCTMSRDEFLNENIKAMKKLIPYAEKYSIKILIENIGRPGEGYSALNAEDMIALCDGVGHELFGVNWDVGHANLCGADQYKEITALGKRLFGLHIHDNNGYSDFGRCPASASDLHILPLMGTVDYDSVIKALIDTGYRGAFNFEVVYTHKPVVSNDAGSANTGTPDIISASDRLLYLTGKHMLGAYGIFEP